MKLAYRSEKNAEAVARFWGKSLEKPDWYRIEAKETDETAEIIIYDVIGYPYNDAFDLVRALGSIKAKNITVRINSPGGDVFDGVAIFNALKDHEAHVTTKIEGLAASMASIVALAGDEVQAHKNAMYMIHDPWVLAAGNQYDLREIADILQKIGGNMLDIYYDKSNIGKRELKAMMKEETWFTAAEAKDRGLIDTVLDAGAAKAKFDLSIFANVPDELEDADREGATLSKQEIERALRDAGASRSFAKSIAARRSNGDSQRDVEGIQAEVQHIMNLMKS
ncbi:head maturation protease, ClpP-related [Methanothrix soehngenii]|uniref:head maturation protease, ClpP-related n=1 Tax=Methanothrix soehngenii TaxID=2223 RepID=UPI002A36E4F2|nr:head maturation protease, ClpP-related [Methanothrix soehngenii]MDY0412838.1 Clp protease ClpP [Methanothrix soehngenii]